MLTGFGPTAQRALLNAHVLVIGSGGLGSPALLYLASSGVGTIGIADFDIIDISNLQRQVLFCQEEIGAPKVDAAHRRLRALNSDLAYNCHPDKISPANISTIISNYDFVIDATDSIQTKLLINDGCVINSKPFCHAGVLEYGGQLMTVIPRSSACVRCVLGATAEPAATPYAQKGIIGAIAGVVGSLQALEAIKYITGTGTLVQDSILTFQGDAMRFHTLRIARNTDCPVCGNAPSITDLNTMEYTSGGSCRP